MRTFQMPFDGVARYSRFRRFTIATEERADLPKE